MFEEVAKIGPEICEKLGISLSDVRGNSRKKTLSKKRMVLFYELRRRTSASWSEIGDFVHRDDSTICQSCKRLELKPDDYTNYLLKMARG
jgi:chromosomal replication initiator protein